MVYTDPKISEWVFILMDTVYLIYKDNRLLITLNSTEEMR